MAGGKTPAFDWDDANIAHVARKEGQVLRKKLADARTEADEARWFEENQDRLLKLFEQAQKEGTLRIGDKSIGITLSQRTETLAKPPSQKVMLRIPTDDLALARRLAASRGLRYQTYIKLLLREGLDREKKARRRA
jgi:predicted DNA binding CopG/RHH family protein